MMIGGGETHNLTARGSLTVAAAATAELQKSQDGTTEERWDVSQSNARILQPTRIVFENRLEKQPRTIL